MSFDNTNVIEGYFSGIKTSMQDNGTTLTTIFDAITLTEEAVLASRDPAQPQIPSDLKDALLLVVSLRVLIVLTVDGLNGLLECVAKAAFGILNDEAQSADACEATLRAAIENNCVVDTFGRMPAEWLMSIERGETVHEVAHVDVVGEIAPDDLMMRLEPFLGNSHRNVAVFKMLNNALSVLNDIENAPSTQNVIPATYTFFNREFGRFAALSETNAEIAAVMSELCTSLESGRFETPSASNQCPQRPSIVDPLFVKVRGPQSTCTSAKVDNTSQPPQTKAVETYQRERLHRGKPSPAKRRKHKCPI